MKEYYIIPCISKENEKSCHHFTEEEARKVIAGSRYTDKSGEKHSGKEHWTAEQVESATAGMRFPEGTNKWDKYVAFNSMYFDLCRVLDDANILKAAHAFYFADDDAPEGKIYRYIHAMREQP